MKLDKRILRAIGIVVAVVLVILVALPLFIDVNRFKPNIESELTNALGRQVTLGNLGLSILSGSIAIKDVSIADDPAFSKSPFITMSSLHVGVELIPLILSKQLKVTKIVLQEPQITLLRAGNKWNYSTLGGTSAKQPDKRDQSSGSQNLSIAKLEVRNGKVIIGKANSSAKPQVYENVKADMTDFSSSAQFPFALSCILPGGGTTNIQGKAGPINPNDSAKTPIEADINVHGLDLAKSGFVEESTGFAGQADLDGTLKSDGKVAKVTGEIHLRKLKLSPKGTPSSELVAMKYAMESDLLSETGAVTQGDIALGKVAAKLTGGFQTRADATILNMRLSAPDMSVDELESFLPAMGVALPSGSKLKGGTLSTDLAITGPLEKMVIAGPVRMSNSKLAGFDMGSKLGALSAFSGKVAAVGGDTTIQNASLNARVAPEGTRADSININVPSLGVVTGAGTVSPSGGLDFKMVADLQAARGNSIPFMVQGTSSNPTFVPDVAGLATSAMKGALSQQIGGKGASNPVSSVTGLFGKKKK